MRVSREGRRALTPVVWEYETLEHHRCHAGSGSGNQSQGGDPKPKGILVERRTVVDAVAAGFSNLHMTRRKPRAGVDEVLGER